MRESVYNYLNTFEPFDMFGLEHIVALIAALAFIIVLPLYAKRNLNEQVQHRLGMVIGWLVFGNYIVWVGLEAIAGTFDIKQHLPVHLCRFTNLAIPLVMVWRSYLAYEILFFWGLSAMLQASFSPDIAAGFPHFHYFRYFAGHHLLVVSIIYAVVVYKLKPTLNSLKKAFIALNVFLLIALFANLILDANYFWIMAKPPTASLLDYMGPWPWYILTGEFVALAHFILAYLLFLLINKINVRS